MEHTTQMGMNRTGVQISPLDAKEMLEASENMSPNDGGDAATVESIRTQYIEEADRIGSVPMPGTLKGAVTTGVKKMTGKNPEVFIDKLGERLAFERSGTRLYEALLLKCQVADAEIGPISVDEVRHFCEEEAAHFNLVAEALETLGADPTAQTPSADATGVRTMGLMQLITDPRSTVPQALSAMLDAELIDNAGWELLIDLAEEAGQDRLAEQFRGALQSEAIHLQTVRGWYEQMVLAESAL
jgi:hypothetical protein